jgi:myo-inositol-1(or 4)-monophosphatase
VTLPHHQDDLELLTGSVRAAGKVALGYFRASPKVWNKPNDSPVSEADIAVETMLARTLRAARPDYGWLSEESVDDGTRLRSPRTFIIDPIDGTRSFISGGTDWTIPVAVVEAGRPVAAVLFAPARDEFYSATVGGGAVRNGEPIRVSTRNSLDGASLAISRRFLRDLADEGLRARSIFYASLAYRLARIADGRLDGAVIKPDARDWDLAAADLILHEAGGLLCDLAGRPPRYDRAETGHPPLIAGPSALREALTRIGQRAEAMAGAADSG